MVSKLKIIGNLSKLGNIFAKGGTGAVGAIAWIMINDKYKCIIHAIIGSIIFVYGLSLYAGQFPTYQ